MLSRYKRCQVNACQILPRHAIVQEGPSPGRKEGTVGRGAVGRGREGREEAGREEEGAAQGEEREEGEAGAGSGERKGKKYPASLGAWQGIVRSGVCQWAISYRHHRHSPRHRSCLPSPPRGLCLSTIWQLGHKSKKCPYYSPPFLNL